MRVIATAGHVDHGKSSLVRALTGTDPDRLEEERRRGLTIDLGFAHTTVADDVGPEEISFVDVPGHVRFLRNMLAGVGGVDACLFVVAGTEGWKPQSEEHLRILELVGVRHGVVAVTKVDVLDDADLVELAVLEVTERVAGTFLAGAPVVPVAAPTGAGRAMAAVGRPQMAACRPAAQMAACRPASTGCGSSWRHWRDARRPPPTATGPGCGSTVSSPPAGVARSSPARSPTAPWPPTSRSCWSPRAAPPVCGPSRASAGPSTASGRVIAWPSTWPASTVTISPGVMSSSPPDGGARPAASTPR